MRKSMPIFDLVLRGRKRTLAKRALRDSEIYLLFICGRVSAEFHAAAFNSSCFTIPFSAAVQPWVRPMS